MTPNSVESLWLEQLVDIARGHPARKLEIRDLSGAVIATLQVHDIPKRPKDMPRALRPKQKLSRRQRTQAKLEKLGVKTLE